MKRILVTGAGGAAATNFTRSLRCSPDKFYLVGTDANKYFLQRAETNKKYLVPPVTDPDFLTILNHIIKKEKIEFVHSQSDVEVAFLNENRDRIKAQTFLPDPETIRICQNKFLSYQKWKAVDLKVPKTMLIKNPAELKKAFTKFPHGLWLRFISGAGGRGSLPTHDYATAVHWINFQKGWGQFLAAELLEPQSVTWMSLWKNGKLIVAQGRKRLYWELGKVSPSGVSGATGAAITVRDPQLDKIALKSILTIDPKPHGLFGVDLTYDQEGKLNPTEINIGRFFTTIHFFTQAGLNMPEIYVKLAYGQSFPKPKRTFNPLPEGLVWIRGLDIEPVLVPANKVKSFDQQLRRSKTKI